MAPQTPEGAQPDATQEVTVGLTPDQAEEAQAPEVAETPAPEAPAEVPPVDPMTDTAPIAPVVPIKPESTLITEVPPALQAQPEAPAAEPTPELVTAAPEPTLAERINEGVAPVNAPVDAVRPPSGPSQADLDHQAKVNAASQGAVAASPNAYGPEVGHRDETAGGAYGVQGLETPAAPPTLESVPTAAPEAPVAPAPAEQPRRSFFSRLFGRR